MTTNMPGSFTRMPGAVRPTAAAPAVLRKVGLVRMLPGSDHMIMIRPPGAEPIRIPCRARDRMSVPRAPAVYFCMHQNCQGKEWPTFVAMAKDHPEPHKMALQQDVHLYGMWSNEPVGAKDPECKACKGSKEPCEQHHGGVIGLIAPPEPRVDGDG